MSKDEQRIVEINGIKVEVDLRTAKRVDIFKVGDKVKLLKKEGYSDGYQSHPGIIIGFDEFTTLPTMIIAYLKLGYSSPEIQYAYINSATKDLEICAAEPDELYLNKEDIKTSFNRCIEAKKNEIKDLEARLAYFEKYFGLYFETSKV